MAVLTHMATGPIMEATAPTILIISTQLITHMDMDLVICMILITMVIISKEYTKSVMIMEIMVGLFWANECYTKYTD